MFTALVLYRLVSCHHLGYLFSVMYSNSWDFNYEGSISSAMNSMDSTVDMDGGGSNDDGITKAQTTLHAPYCMPMMTSDVSLSSETLEGGVHMRDSMLQLQTIPSLHLSSNHLLAAAKWLQQKKFQKALTASGINSSSTNQLQIDNHVQSCTQGVAKISLRNLLEGACGSSDTPSVGDNGSKTISVQQSLSSHSVPTVRNSLSFSEGLTYPCGKEQTEHQTLFYQARPEFHESVLDPFDRTAMEVTQIRDAMWQSHPQMPHGVLVPTFPNHRGLNQPHGASEGVSAKNKPRVRARRGQATDPHSIAERLRRERIADRMKMLQELVPSTNKTDRAVMLDEIIEYVKFLVIQVKILSMSRLGGAGLVVPLVGGLPHEGKSPQASTAGQSEASSPDSMPAIEEHVARLMIHNVGAALQFLQRKGLCLMPISMTEAKLGADANLSLTNQGCLLDQSSSPVVTGNCPPMQT